MLVFFGHDFHECHFVTNFFQALETFEPRSIELNYEFVFFILLFIPSSFELRSRRGLSATAGIAIVRASPQCREKHDLKPWHCVVLLFFMNTCEAYHYLDREKESTLVDIIKRTLGDAYEVAMSKGWDAQPSHDIIQVI